MAELKPCPFCGGEAKIVDQSSRRTDGSSFGGKWKYIRCTKCAYKSELYFWDDRKTMIDDWNRRADDD